MKNLVVVIVLIAIAAAVYFYVWPALQGGYSGMGAEDRVRGWLEAQKGGDEQTALCIWAAGKPMLSLEEMRAWTDDYDAFRNRLGIYEGIDSFSIDSVSPPYVTVRINGARHTFRVESGSAISLSD